MGTNNTTKQISITRRRRGSKAATEIKSQRESPTLNPRTAKF